MKDIYKHLIAIWIFVYVIFSINFVSFNISDYTADGRTFFCFIEFLCSLVYIISAYVDNQDKGIKND